MKTILVLLSIAFSFNVFSMVENDRRIKKAKVLITKVITDTLKCIKLKTKSLTLTTVKTQFTTFNYKNNP